MKIITYLKSTNRVTHIHFVLGTTFHNKQMMSSSGTLVLGRRRDVEQKAQTSHSIYSVNDMLLNDLDHLFNFQ